MKKALLTVLVLLLAYAGAAMAEQTSGQTLEGLITAVEDSDFLLQEKSLGPVRVNLDEATTAYDGIAEKGKLTEGMYVFVTYDGVLTRSDPPQATARKVGCYRVEGTVSEILQNGYLVAGDSVLGTVLVHMDLSMPPVYRGVPITLYYNGVMALSLPPQISAAYLVVPTLDGTVSALTSDGFTLTAADGTAYPITLSATTRLSTLPANGEAVRVYYDGAPITDAAITALEISVPAAQSGASVQVQD